VAYRGVTAKLPIGAQGFTGTRNQSQAGPGHFTYTEGAELDAGIIRKDGGAKLIAEIGQFTSVRSLMHFNNAAEGSTVITDAGSAGAVWSVVGGAKTTLTDFKFGPSSLTLNGTTDWVTSPSTLLPTAGNEFTIHTWFKTTAVAVGRRNLLGQIDSAGNIPTLSVAFYLNAASVMEAQVGQGSTALTITGTTVFTNSSHPGWHHVALVRDNTNPVSNKLVLYLDGVQEASLIISGAVNNSSALRAIGQIGALTTNPWQGLVDETVVRVGVAQWKANFTPPTVPTLAYGAGAEAPFDTPLPIIQGTSWSPGVGLDEDVVVLSNGGVLSDPTRTGLFDVTLTTGLTITRDPPPYFCVAGGEDVGQPRKLFLFSASNQLQVRKGTATTFASISTPPADWAGAGNFPTFGCVHELRLFAGGNASDPHRLYYSSITDHEVYTGSGAGAAGTIPIFPGQGEKLVAAYSVRGALILFKYPVGIYVLQTQDPDPTTWSVDVLSRAIGSVNGGTIIQIENDILYLDRSGSIHMLSATTDFGDFNTSNLSEIASMQPFMKDEVNRSRMQRAQAIYYTNKRQAWFYVPRTNSDLPNLRLQIGFPTLQQQQIASGAALPRFFMSRRDQANTVWLRPDNTDGVLKPTIGGDNGCIYQLDDDVRAKYYGGSSHGYPIEFSTADTDLSFVDPSVATRHKNGQFLEITYEPEGEWDLLVDIYWDDVYTETVAFNMGGAGGVLGTMVLGLDLLGAAGVKSSRRRVPGSGRRFKMNCRNDGVNQNVSIAEFFLSFSVGDERTAE